MMLIDFIDTYSSVNISTDVVLPNVFECVLNIVETKHIIFFYIFAFIQRVQTNENLPVKVRMLLASLPDTIAEIGRHERDRWDQKFYYPLSNWTNLSS